MERNAIPRYVPDASVAVKWFIDEQDSEKARLMKDLFSEGALDLEAPTLIQYETASALRFHPVVKLNSNQFLIVMQSLDGLQITREPTSAEWATSHMLTLENPISIYDSIYIAFAIRDHSIMVTADAALVDRIKAPDTKKKLILLSDLSLDDVSKSSPEKGKA